MKSFASEACECLVSASGSVWFCAEKVTYHLDYLCARDVASLLDKLVYLRRGWSFRNWIYLILKQLKSCRSTPPHQPRARPKFNLKPPPDIYLATNSIASHIHFKIIQQPFMFSRLSQLARHLSRPLPNYAHTSAASSTRSLKALGSGIMTSTVSADERATRTIHTAACLIIGDEVLGGKVCLAINPIERSLRSQGNFAGFSIVF